MSGAEPRIAIAGCGPAGLATALFLHKQGKDITLLERFDEPRPVGSGLILQPTGLAVLRELGLHRQIASLGRRIDRIHGQSMPSGKTVLDVNYAALGSGFHGIAVHRSALFDVLFDAVREAGIRLQTSVAVNGMLRDGDTVQVLDETGTAIGEYDLLIDASGARSPLQPLSRGSVSRRELDYGALWGSFDWPGDPFVDSQLEQRYVDAHTMIGMLPIGTFASLDKPQVAFFWSLKTRDYPAWLGRGLDAWKQQVLRIWPETEPVLEQIHDAGQLTLARYGHCTLAPPFGDGIVFIGDAAHATSPQLGQGANMALLDAWVLAGCLGRHSVPRAVTAYERARRWHVRAFQFSSLAMTPFYQSDSVVLAKVRDALFDPVSRIPIARRIVAGLISGLLASPPKDLDYAGLFAEGFDPTPLPGSAEAN